MFKITQGFTLVELMIVVAIVAILAVIAQAAYSGYQRDALKREAIASIFSINSDATKLIYDWGLSKAGGSITEELYAPNPAIEVDTAGAFDKNMAKWSAMGIELDGLQRWCYQLCFYYDATRKEENFAIVAIHPSASGNDYGYMLSSMSQPIFDLSAPPTMTDCAWKSTCK